jgi:cyclic pyranopterin phosphate synthase
MMEAPAAGPLEDGYGRRIDYLRVSVTDRCDLRCSYCLPKDFKGFETPANWLSHEEMARLVGLFVALGVSKVRLTGGEPLLRRGVAGLAGAIAAMPGLADLSVSTNGTQLARHAQALREAGVDRLNVSLDTLDAAAFGRITGRDCLESVLSGLAAARRAGFAPIKLNSVVHAATPEAEVRRLLDYAVAQGFVLRLIEPMPMGECGRGFSHTDLNALGARLPRPLLDDGPRGAGAGRDHAHVPPFLRQLQPGQAGRGRHALPVPGAGRPGAVGAAAARRRGRRRADRRHPGGHRGQARAP